MCSHKTIHKLIAAAAFGGVVVQADLASAQMLTSARVDRDAPAKASPMRIVVSVKQRRLWAIEGGDTVLSAPVAVAKNTTLSFAGHEYTFKTPRGTRHVLRKESDPLWQPPDWMYFEVAQQNGLRVQWLKRGSPVDLGDGRKLTVRDDVVGIVENGEFESMPVDEHIVFGNTLYVPPMGTTNRKVPGALGDYRLDLGDGYFLHGTPFKDSIGRAATHGCIRLRDADIAWLYNNVPVGTKVLIN